MVESSRWNLEKRGETGPPLKALRSPEARTGGRGNKRISRESGNLGKIGRAVRNPAKPAGRIAHRDRHEGPTLTRPDTASDSRFLDRNGRTPVGIPAG